MSGNVSHVVFADLPATSDHERTVECICFTKIPLNIKTITAVPETSSSVTVACTLCAGKIVVHFDQVDRGACAFFLGEFENALHHYRLAYIDEDLLLDDYDFNVSFGPSMLCHRPNLTYAFRLRSAWMLG